MCIYIYRKGPNCFESGGTILPSYQQCMRNAVATFGTGSLCNSGHSHGSIVVSRVCFLKTSFFSAALDS